MFATIHRSRPDVRETLAEIYGPSRNPISPRPALVHAATGRPTFEADSLADTLRAPARGLDVNPSPSTSHVDLRAPARGLDVHPSPSASHVERSARAPVWHCSLGQTPGSRRLADAEWTSVARRIVAAAGIADPAQGPACPWIAVRDRTTEHLHLIAPAGRRNGTTPNLLDSSRRVVAEANAIGRELNAQNSRPRTEPPAFAYDPARTVFLRSHMPGVVAADGGDTLARAILLGAGFDIEHSPVSDGGWMRTPFGIGDTAPIEHTHMAARELSAAGYRVEADRGLHAPLASVARAHAAATTSPALPVNTPGAATSTPPPCAGPTDAARHTR